MAVTVAARQLSRIGVTVSNLRRLKLFYCDALGFSCLDEGPVPAPECRTLGLAGSAIRARLQLGEQRLELLCPAKPGAPYPTDRQANDIWFQHIAIVVRDMDAAYDRIVQYGIEPISRQGPQLLPPSAGHVRAFKFRDPDGHPLELIAFPAGSGDPVWQRPTGDALFLGIDHSAIVVRDAERSIAFYETLGLSILSRSLNHGPEQDRLDGLAKSVATVIGLQPADIRTPYVELLAYQPPAAPLLDNPLGPSDLASARLVFTVAHSDDPAVAGWDDGGMLLHDPDGHALILEPLARA
jgi:catechol 2,3-dioxygenase-like lactoylglutathione lyase family enzyme